MPALRALALSVLLLLGVELVGALKLVAQTGRAQVLADIGQALLQLLERLLNIFRVGVGNVAPHGIRAGGDARHLAQGSAANAMQLGIVAELFFERCRERGCNHLGKMTDPGAQAVVAPTLHAQRARANHLDQLAKLVRFAGKRAGSILSLVLSFVLSLLFVLV